MLKLTRRSFVAAGAAVPFSTWLRSGVAASAAKATRVRHEVRTPQGKAMLKIYAGAVAKMKATPGSDPRSWVFQWYTHWVNGATSKSSELTRLFPAASAERNLAAEVWNTCQAHGGEDENFFLPWHRMFLLYFEGIVGKLGGDDSFTLPYWNYSAGDSQTRGVLPQEFRMPNDPLFKSLYVRNRNPGVNAGKPIQQGQPGDPLSTAMLAECNYESTPSIPGFCMDLDQQLHGNVHVLVGNQENMGTIPYSANDPIFWVHHCNIDRLWASWTAGGRTTPTITGSFVFGDEKGQRVVAKVEDFMDLGKVGYVYDTLEAVSPCTKPAPAAVAAAAADQKVLVKARATPVSLGSGPVEVTLEPAAGANPDAAPLAASVQDAPANRRIFLVIRDLKAEAQPGVLYHVYLDVPADAKDEARQAHHVGSLNFFNAVRHSANGHGAADNPPAKGTAKFVRFDITDLARKLHTQGVLRAKPVVTIAPVGQPAEDAKPVIGEVTIVEQ